MTHERIRMSVRFCSRMIGMKVALESNRGRHFTDRAQLPLLFQYFIAIQRRKV